MKTTIVLFCLALFSGLSSAEPPRRFRNRFLSRQEVAPAPEAEATTPAGEPSGSYGPPSSSYGPPTEAAPYPPSGWKPEGKRLELPTEKANPPDSGYGAPQPEYGAPAPGETDITTVEPESETVPPEATAPARLRSQKLIRPSAQQGDFFLLVPGSNTLQRLELVPSPDSANGRFARLQQAQPVFILRP